MIDLNNLPSPSSFRHRCGLQLRFNDVDVLGHVNNTVYFSFYDTGKAYYFTDVRGQEMNWKRVDTVIANVNCAYLSPIVFGDEMEVLTRCESIHDKSFRLMQMLVEKRTGTVKSVCETVMVTFDPATQKAIPISDEWRAALSGYEGRELSAKTK